MTQPRPLHPTPPEDLLPPLAEEDGNEDDSEVLLELPVDDGGDLLDDSTGDEEVGIEEFGIRSDSDEHGWTDDSEGDDSGHEEDVDNAGTEYGWTTDMEEQGTEDWDEELPGGDENASILDDAGEEGADEQTELDLSFDPLPAEEEDEDDDAGVDGAHFESESHAEGWLPPAYDEDRILMRSLGPAETVLSVMAAWRPGVVLGGGQGLYVTNESPTLEAVECAALDGEDLTSIAVGAGHPDLVAVGTFLSGVFCSVDGGRSFVPANTWSIGSRRPGASAYVSAIGTTLLLRTADGGLFTSTDRGTSWVRAPLGGRAVAHAVSSSGRVHALVLSEPGPVIAMSDDAARTWTVGPVVAKLKALAAASDIVMAASHGLIVLGAEDFAEGCLVSTDHGETFRLWDSTPRATSIAMDPSEPHTCYVAVCYPGRNVAAVIRTSDAGASFATVFELDKVRTVFGIEASSDAELEHRVNALAFDPGGRVLLVASTAGGFVVQVRDEHDPA